MKIHGQHPATPYRRVVQLPRPDGTTLPLTLQPLPLGFHRRLRDHHLNSPVAPTRVARDPSGKPLRDPQGLAILVRDEYDPAHLAAVELFNQRVAVLMIAEALRADPQVEFETRLPEQGDWTRAADDLHLELERAGWSEGDVLWLCQQIFALSNLLDEHLQAAHANFSSAVPAGAD